MKIAKIISLSGVMVVLLTIAGICGDNSGNVSTDYSKSECWLSLPSYDGNSVVKDVDLFYVYPTVWQKGTEPNSSPISTIDDPKMMAGAKFAFNIQATAFETIANIYAPYYRQYDAGYMLSMPLDEQYKIMGAIPTSDVVGAFDYYIKNCNKGRPFILAGHSQGSNVLLFLLQDYMKNNPPVYNRMIAAYIIGYSVTGEYLEKNPHLKFATGPDDTGVIISYNTEYSGYTGNPVNPVIQPGAMAINPINWKRDGTIAPETDNLGSLVFDKNRNITDYNRKNYADAQIVNDNARGVEIVKCSTVDPNMLGTSPTFPTGVYHSCDYPFYYYNIRENATNRTEIFLNR